MKRTSLLTSLAVAAALAVPLAAFATETAAPAKTTAKQSSTSTAKPAKAHSAPKVDLNAASKDDLMKVKGMTDAEADKILAGRPYKNVGELKSKKILDSSAYSKLHAHFMVKKTA